MPANVFERCRIEGKFGEGDGLYSASDVSIGTLGCDALVAASFACKFCTLRVRDSTFVVSFLLFFSILFGI
jgi:hypothetical protein